MIPDAVDRDIILLTSLFQIADPDRRAEFRKCIELNLKIINLEQSVLST